MLKFSRNSNVDIPLYDVRIRGKEFVLVDRAKMTRVYYYERTRSETLAALAKKVMVANSCYGHVELSKPSVVSYLREIERVSESYFYPKKNQREPSLDAKFVLAKIYNNGLAREFLDYYVEYTSSKSKCDRISKVLQRLVDHGEVSREGVPLYRLYYTVKEQENLRFNYKNEDLISLGGEYSPSFAVEDGYFLGWGDYAQSDLRIAYNLLIRDDWNAPIMDTYTDKYEGIGRVVAAYFKEEFNHELFLQERELYKAHTLATIYGLRSHMNAEANAFIKKFSTYLNSCPKYVEFFKRIEERFDLGLSLPITGYFGYEQFVPTENKHDATNKALNAPVQTGTSQIVILSVNKILEMFYERGYTEEDISIYMVRHDEPIFKIHNRVKKDLWILNQASTILVDNWTPLKLDFEFGYYYSESDVQLEEEIEKVYLDNSDKIEVLVPDETALEYWPVPDTFTVYVGMQFVGLKTMISIYNAKKNQVAYIVADTPEKSVAYELLRQKLVLAQDELFDLGYRGVVVFNEVKDETLYDGSLFYNMTTKYNSTLSAAHILAHYMAYRYAAKYSVPFETDMALLEKEKTFLSKVGELSVLQK
jgi:hypothetical protein